MSSLKCLAVLLIALSSVQSKCGRKIGTTIINGEKSEPGEWPWVANLVDIPTQKFFCGATIISEKALITVANCIQPKHEQTPKKAEEIVALLGKYNLSLAYERGVEAFYPNEILIHPEWNILSNRYDADLAIMRSESAIKFSVLISPVCLWSENFPNNENVEGFISSWADSNEPSKIGDISRHVGIRQIQGYECLLNDHHLAIISSNRTFCGAGSDGNIIPCRDAGKGLFVLKDDIWYIHGIAAVALMDATFGCDVNSYTIFSELSKYSDWINMRIKEKNSHANQ